jgi:ComF family protein
MSSVTESADDSPWRRRLRRAAGLALDSVLPPRCLRCGTTVDAVGALCPECWGRMAFLGAPHCACCGYPFEFEMGPAALCAACSRAHPAYDRARAVLRYDDSSRDLVLAFKHADRTDGAPAYGRWLARAGAELLADIDLIAPVPLHWSRLFARRYNQAALLALALARETGLPAVPDLLVRRRRTRSQGRLSAAARERNVTGAFALHPRRSDRVAGRRVLLVDDVLTTGATVEACARLLRREGAAAVEVLTLARVVRPQN